MSARATPDDELRRCLRAIEDADGNLTHAAQALGISRQTLQSRYRVAQARGLKAKEPFTIAPLPDENLSAEELIERRKIQFAKKHAAEQARKLIPIKINLDGPIGVCHFGDPHVDDDGTDIARLERDVKLVNETEGLFGANVGDLQNNWVGRLARLYAEQSTSASESWILAEWLIRAIPWLYIIAGNHDMWSGSGDPAKWISAHAGTVYEEWGVRAELQFPNGKKVRINARHDFSGHSMWNPVHGPMKAIQAGWRDHLLTAGHKHTSFYAGPLKDPATGLLSHALRPAGYKIYDRYAKEKGLPDQNAFPSSVTIIDPRFDDDDTRLITVIHDVEYAADVLGFLRKKHG